MMIPAWATFKLGLTTKPDAKKLRRPWAPSKPEPVGQAPHFPAIPEIDVGRMLALDAIAEELTGARFDVVPIAIDCEDGFLCAWWARPEAYLDPVVRAGISCFPGCRAWRRGSICFATISLPAAGTSATGPCSSATGWTSVTAW